VLFNENQFVIYLSPGQHRF